MDTNTIQMNTESNRDHELAAGVGYKDTYSNFESSKVRFANTRGLYPICSYKIQPQSLTAESCALRFVSFDATHLKCVEYIPCA